MQNTKRPGKRTRFIPHESSKSSVFAGTSGFLEERLIEKILFNCFIEAASLQPNALALGKEKRESSYRVTTKKENLEKVSFRSSTIYKWIVTHNIDKVNQEFSESSVIFRIKMKKQVIFMF